MLHEVTWLGLQRIAAQLTASDVKRGQNLEAEAEAKILASNFGLEATDLTSLLTTTIY